MLNDLRDLWRYRELARLLVAKELKLRYRRSVLGFAWTMLNPLMTMIILTVVFSQVMRVQVDSFPVFVLCALLPWNFFAQSITGGSLSILHNESLLRNVRVPRAIFPICMVTSHFVNLLLALVPLLIVMAVMRVAPTPALLLLPWFLFTHLVFTIGVVLALSAWTVFFRDVAQIVEVSVTALFYLTPIIYPMSILPEKYARLFELNPLYWQITPFRTLFYDGAVPLPLVFAISGGLAIAALVGGLAVFRRKENQFLLYLS